MDKNTTTGFILIAIVLIAFSYFNRPSAEEQRAAFVQDSIAQVARMNAEKKQKAEAAAKEALAKQKAEEDTTALFHNALKGYTRLNLKGFQSIKSGGILFTFSCSQVVTKDHFRNAVFTAAAQAGRKVRILHQLHQPADHPINIYHPEGEYLKGLVLYVE